MFRAKPRPADRSRSLIRLQALRDLVLRVLVEMPTDMHCDADALLEGDKVLLIAGSPVLWSILSRWRRVPCSMSTTCSRANGRPMRSPVGRVA